MTSKISRIPAVEKGVMLRIGEGIPRYSQSEGETKVRAMHLGDVVQLHTNDQWDGYYGTLVLFHFDDRDDNKTTITVQVTTDPQYKCDLEHAYWLDNPINNGQDNKVWLKVSPEQCLFIAPARDDREHSFIKLR